MKRLFAFLVALAFASPLFADLKVEQSQKGNRLLIILTVAGSDAANAGAIWDITPSDGVESVETPGQLTFTGPARMYTVKLRGVLWEKKQIITAVWQGAIGGGTKPPDKPDPPVPDPPLPPSGKFYFAIVRHDGPASAAFTKLMSDPAWSDIRSAGHAVKDFAATDAKRLGIPVPASAQLPVVVTLQTSEKESKVVREAIPLPTTADGIRKLMEVPNG